MERGNERLSLEDYTAIKEKANEFVAEYKKRGMEVISSSDINAIVDSVPQLSSDGKKLLSTTLMFPSDKEFVAKYEELGHSTSELAKHYNRDLTDIVSKISILSLYGGYMETQAPEVLEESKDKLFGLDECRTLESESIGTIEKLSKAVVEARNTIEDYKALVSQKESIISAKESAIAERDGIIYQKEGIIAEKEAEISGLGKQIANRDMKISDLEGQIDLLTEMLMHLHTTLRSTEVALEIKSDKVIDLPINEEEMGRSRAA